MNPCDPRWREELADHALGQPVSPALREHLAACSDCRATLQKWQQRMERIDDGVRQFAVSEPSPHADSRVIAALRERPQASSWLHSWGRRTALLGALGAVAIFLAYAWTIHEQRSEAVKALAAANSISTWRSPTASLLHSPNGDWLDATPRLGNYFYSLNSKTPQKEKENP
jgi:anti-sigma factor RsiW